ncbi:ubiquitin conjugating enzyme E2 [Acrasis kona]|uniref:E2 ubiquitin-conjugating enzyme n=1 Tax=Acrasis kona TaxID=1008807 RepID=A0AAW2ZSK4_9EUKA
MSQILIKRMQHEMTILENPPAGIQAYLKNEDKINLLEAKIQGTAGTPYEGGTFKLEITIPDRYDPPIVKFNTPIYHPNIDSGGRICLDILNGPPKGQWKPSININSTLLSIQQLMNDPNPDDPLMAEITKQYRENKPQFIATAKEWTKKHALDQTNVVKPKAAKKVDDDSSDSDSGSESDSDEEPAPKKQKLDSKPTAPISTPTPTTVEKKDQRKKAIIFEDKEEEKVEPTQKPITQKKPTLTVKRKKD